MDLLRWTLAFLLLALSAGILGFGRISAEFTLISKILLCVFAVLLLVSFLFRRGGSTRL